MPLPVPPVAEPHPTTTNLHGRTRRDDYAWMRDPNWTAVLEDPSLLSEHIRRHLEAENRYTESVLEPASALRERLREELLARMAIPGSSVPVRYGLYDYFERIEPGRQHPVLCRRGPDGERILLDLHEQAAAHPGLRLVGARHSPDHTRFAYSIDEGTGRCTIRILDISANVLLPDVLTGAYGVPAWTADGSGIVYAALDEAQRPCAARLHRIGTSQSEDRTLYDEHDPAFFVRVTRSASGRFIVLTSRDHGTAEVRFVPASAPESKLVLFAPRRPGLDYRVEDASDRWFILNNRDGAEDFEIAECPIDDPDPARWRPLVPHRPGRLLLDWVMREPHLAVLALEDGSPRLFVHDIRSRAEREIVLPPEESFDVQLVPGAGEPSNVLRLVCGSPIVAPRTYDIDLDTDQRTLRRDDQAPPGHDPARYVCRRIFVCAHDGESIPVTIVHHRHTRLDGTAPLVLHGYGAYGVPIKSRFSPEIFSLVDRGFVYATAHVRGGRDRGERWYRDGRHMRKNNSFEDFLAVANHLIEVGYTADGLLTCHGASAGGLLVGTALNRRPDLFRAAVAEVPFVDALATMCDATLPLTPREWPEWGNPIENAAAYDEIASWSPVDNVTPQAYPAVFATAGLTDPYVGYWEPARWVARMRSAQTGDRPITLWTRMSAGHLGRGGRLDQIEDTATAWAFVLMAYRADEYREPEAL